MTSTCSGSTRASERSRRCTGALAHWRAGAPVAGPVQVAETGDVIAVLEKGTGVELVRWDGRTGREVSRRPVAIAGRVLATRLAGGRLVVVTEAEVARVEVSEGKVLARAPIGARVRKGGASAAPNGAWLLLTDRLLHLGLDGTRVERALPIGAGPGGGAVMRLRATVGDGCLVAEERHTYHAVRGRDSQPDRTSLLALTLLSPSGEVVAQHLRGKELTRREWLWAESSAEGPVPRAVGLVRTRHEGSVVLEALAQRPGGFVFVSDEQVGEHEFEHWLVALDPELRARWAIPFRGMVMPGTPPIAGGGSLFRTNVDEVRLYDDATGTERVAALPVPEDVPSDDLIGTALGRGPDGAWIVVTYAPKRE